MLKSVNKKLEINEIKDILGDCKKCNNFTGILKIWVFTKQLNLNEKVKNVWKKNKIHEIKEILKEYENLTILQKY